MTNPWRVPAALIASVTVLSCAVSCSKKNKNSMPDVSEPESTATAESTAPAADPHDAEITWLADYDLNDPGYERPAALAIYEDIYGGRINYVQTTPDNKLSKLAEMINAGEEVDMFPYEDGTFPEGVCRDLFQPLDPYYDQLGMNEGIWDDMSEVIDMFAYKGEHYVVPYSLS